MAKVVREYSYPGFFQKSSINGRIAFDSEGNHFVVGSRLNHAIVSIL